MTLNGLSMTTRQFHIWNICQTRTTFFEASFLARMLFTETALLQCMKPFTGLQAFEVLVLLVEDVALLRTLVSAVHSEIAALLTSSIWSMKIEIRFSFQRVYILWMVLAICRETSEAVPLLIKVLK